MLRNILFFLFPFDVPITLDPLPPPHSNTHTHTHTHFYPTIDFFLLLYIPFQKKMFPSQIFARFHKNGVIFIPCSKNLTIFEFSMYDLCHVMCMSMYVGFKSSSELVLFVICMYRLINKYYLT